MTDSVAALRAELAPTGILRAGLNHSNFLLVGRDASGAPRGIAVDLAREIGRRLSVPVAFVSYDSPGTMADAAKTGVWDIAFLGSEPTRAAEIFFSAAYLEITATYLVPPGSPLKTVADVDREGVRIAVSARSAYDLYLLRTLKRAKLVHAEGIQASYDVFVAEKLDALAGLLPRLVTDVEKIPGARILDGQFTAIQQSIGTPRGRDRGAQFLREFVEEAKSTGFVAKVIAQNNVRGVSVAPLAPK
jgi:polar amino acid transport system substrate-binding protein